MGQLYKRKPKVVEAITFNELIEYGRNNGANIENGMPWSFHYKGEPVTHETDDKYLVGFPHTQFSNEMTPDDMLLWEDNKLDIWTKEQFDEYYEKD